MSLSWNRMAYYLIVLIGVLSLSFFLIQKKNHPFNKPIVDAPSVPVVKNHQTTPQDTQPVSQKKEIPAYVLNVLNHVLKYQEAPPNYVGGRIFQNREKKLKSFDSIGDKIQYKEWDVHPKVKGQNRGAERLITG